MIAGHRWEKLYDWRGYECVPLPFGGVESHQWCVGCGCRIGDKELCESGYDPLGDSGLRNVQLDILASGKGFEPVEAGTMAEWKLRKSKRVD